MKRAVCEHCGSELEEQRIIDERFGPLDGAKVRMVCTKCGKGTPMVKMPKEFYERKLWSYWQELRECGD